MEFSEKAIFLIGSIIGLLLALPLVILIGKTSVTYMQKYGIKEKITSKSFFSLLIFTIIFYAFSILFHYTNVVITIIVGCAIEGFLLYFYMQNLNQTRCQQNSEKLIEKKYLVYLSFWYAVLIPVVSMATVAGLQWLMPDIIEISKKNNSFVTKEYYIFPYTEGTRPGGSYIDNITNDTIFRILVRYAYLGEELHNLYTIEGIYPPGQFARMSYRVNYAMKDIPPIMLESSNRLGRYHTKRTFLTNRTHLEEFRRLNMNEFGLKKNLYMDSITPEKDRTIREDPSRYDVYKYINPDPYRHNR